MKTLRFGVIGAGLMGREFASAAARWAHLLEMNVRPEIVAVCDTNIAMTQWFTQHFAGIKQVTTNYHDLLENPDIDAIYCAVPHHLHAQLYCDIIHAQKHLLGEKPFGIDAAANAQIMQAIAANPHILVRCSSEFVFFPAVQRIFALAQAGAFGRILELEAGFWHSSDLDPNKPMNWKRIVETNGEYGVMGDLGFHVLHLPARLGFVPKDVRAILSNIVQQRPDHTGKLIPCDTWDNAHLFCHAEYAGQTFPMMLSTKRIAPSETNTWFFRLIGTNLSAEFSTKRPKTLRLLPYMSGQPQAWQELDLGYESAYKSITGTIFEFGFSDAILQMWAAFCEELGGNLPKFACGTPEEAALSHRLFSAALESHAQQKVVVL